MILYNVTVKVDRDIEEEWKKWMKQKHIPDVMDVGIFNDYKFFELISVQEEDGTTYAIQYFCDTVNDLERYHEQYAPALQKEHTEKYKDKCVAFRTVMETV